MISFHWALVPQNQPITIKPVKADGAGDDVAVRTATKLYDNDDLSLRLDTDGAAHASLAKLGELGVPVPPRGPDDPFPDLHL